MRVAITGAGGLLGSALAASLAGDGHEVVPIIRAGPTTGAITWDPAAGVLDPRDLDGLDAVVHLAGEPIGDRRWTDAVKRRIHESRVLGTMLLAEAIASRSDPPTLLSGSAVGWYGDRGDEVLTEDSRPGDDFLSMVCVDWEAATRTATQAGARVCQLRTGVVIASEGALIGKVRLPFRLGLGGRVGDGRQFVPWIALADHVAAVRFLLQHDDLAGAFNLVAPNPVTNRELTRALGEVLGRPAVLPIPVAALRLLYGEMGVVLAASSQRVVPDRLSAADFPFAHDNIRSGLRVALV